MHWIRGRLLAIQVRGSHPQQGVGGAGFWIGNVIVMAGVSSIMRAMLDEVAPKLKIGIRMFSETVRADAREGDIGMQLGEIAKANPAIAIGSYPFFDPHHGPNTNVVLRARDAQKLALAKRAVEDMLEQVRQAQSVGELALSRRKQGFESPRERQRNQRLIISRRLVSNSCPINVYGQAWTTAHQRRPVHRRHPSHGIRAV